MHVCYSAGFKPTKLDPDEQAKIAKVGLEMKLVTSEMEAEAEKWDDPQNEIVKVGYFIFQNERITNSILLFDI